MRFERNSPAVMALYKYTPKILVVVFVYFLFAQLGLSLASLNMVASPVWPASGIAMFFVLLWGPVMAVGVFFGSLAGNIFTNSPPNLLVGIALGTTLEALLGVWIFFRISKAVGNLSLHSRGVVFVAVSTLATAISATFGTFFLIINEIISFDLARTNWLTWWVGDSLGVLIMFPLGVRIYENRKFSPLTLRQTFQLVLTTALTLGLCALVFLTGYGSPYLFVIFLSLLLSAMWFSAVWIYITSILICTFAIYATKFGFGPFNGGVLNENLLHLELLLAGVGLTAIILETLKQEGSLKMPGLALIFGWILTGMTFYSFYQASIESDEGYFTSQVNKAEKDLQGRLEDYIRLLETGGSLFSASNKVTRDEWYTFISGLDYKRHYPGIDGIGVIIPIKNKAEEVKLTNEEKQNGVLDFKLHDLVSPSSGARIADSSLKLVIRYIEPMEIYRKAVGLVISTEQHRLESALKARDTGLPAITEKIVLFQDEKFRPAFVIFAPFYNHKEILKTVEIRRESFRGLVFAPVVIENFINTALADYSNELDLKIFLGGQVNSDRQVYASSGWQGAEKPLIMSKVFFADRLVTLLWKKGPEFKTHSSIVASWAGFCGSLISIFLAVILSSLENVKERAQKIAAQTTFELSEREKELQLRHTALIASARMSSLGQMAGGMAHEINNPLAIISGKAQHLEILLNTQPLNIEKAKEHLHGIRSNVDRIAKIIKGLRSFARDVPEDPFRVVAARDIMEDTLELCRSRFKHHEVLLLVPTEVSLDWKVRARPEQIVQVLLNLLNNAFDAVAGLPEKWVQLDVELDGGKLIFSVTDSGHGLPAELKEKIFDPFFTTKEIGKGTGLGLSISKGIIDKHSGRLYVDEKSTHTKFVIELEAVGNHA